MERVTKVANAPQVPAVTVVATAKHGTLTLNAPCSAIPALRIVKWHAPEMRVECTDDHGGILMLPLSSVDLSHESLRELNAARPSFVPEPSGIFPAVNQAVAEAALTTGPAQASTPQGSERNR